MVISWDFGIGDLMSLPLLSESPHELLASALCPVNQRRERDESQAERDASCVEMVASKVLTR
jgi:hypothetical protein